jgi:autoinducer 2-degrading protein
VSHVAIVARITVKEGRAGEYVAAFEPLLEQAKQEPGTLLYALHRSKDDPHVFWTTEVYADDAAFAAHSASEVHAAASPVFTGLIAAADVLIGETLIATGLGGLSRRRRSCDQGRSLQDGGRRGPGRRAGRFA